MGQNRRSSCQPRLTAECCENTATAPRMSSVETDFVAGEPGRAALYIRFHAPDGTDPDAGLCARVRHGLRRTLRARVFRQTMVARFSPTPFGHRAGRQGTSMIRDPDHAPRSSWRGLRGAQICALPNYSGAPAIATGTSVPVLGAGFAQVTVPRTLAPWARAWDSVMVSFSWSLGALRASFQVATLLTTP